MTREELRQQTLAGLDRVIGLPFVFRHLTKCQQAIVTEHRAVYADAADAVGNAMLDAIAARVPCNIEAREDYNIPVGMVMPGQVFIAGDPANPYIPACHCRTVQRWWGGVEVVALDGQLPGRMWMLDASCMVTLVTTPFPPYVPPQRSATGRWKFAPEWEYTPCVRAGGPMVDLMRFVQAMRDDDDDGLVWIMNHQGHRCVQQSRHSNVALRLTDELLQDPTMWTAGATFIADSKCLVCDAKGATAQEAMGTLRADWGPDEKRIPGFPAGFAIVLPASEVDNASNWSEA